MQNLNKANESREKMSTIKKFVLNNKWLVGSYILIGVAISFIDSFNANYYQVIIDKFTAKSLHVSDIAIYAIALLLWCVLEYIDEYPGNLISNRTYFELKISALRKIKTIKYEVYQHLGVGNLIQKVENGAEAGRSILCDFYLCVIREQIPAILFSLYFIYKINKMVMCGIAIGYIVVFIITKILLNALYDIKQKILINEELFSHYLVRGFMEMAVFRVYRRFDWEEKKLDKAKTEIVDKRVKMTLVHEAFFTIFAILVSIIKIAIIGYGWKTQTITIGEVIALISLVDKAYSPVAIFNVLLVQYKLDQIAYERYEEFLHEEDDLQIFGGKCIDHLDGRIELKNVQVGYNEKDLFSGLNILIKAGEKVALVGESGTGKTTIIKIILGLMKPKRGEVLINGIENLDKINLNSYYQYISYIPQESPIFDGTLRENIVFDKMYTDKEIINVLEKVDMLEWYKKLDNGLDTYLGEKGILVSGGERQRIALARLWFDDAAIIVLDEATSALDNITEKEVMENVMKKLENKTVITIAHRLERIKKFDKIVVLKSGKIVGEGKFDSLAENNLYFRELYSTNQKELGGV